MLSYKKFLEKSEYLKPSYFLDTFPNNSIFKKSEYETICFNIINILANTGDIFREISWEEYKKRRLKDGNFTNIEKYYFDKVIKYTVSEDMLMKFSNKWKNIIKDTADKYKL